MKEICVKINGCKELIISDNYNWEDTDPSVVVSNTLITLKYISSTTIGDVITVINENTYVDTVTIMPSTIDSSWTKFQDGYFQIKIIFTLNNDSTIKTYTEVFNKCNLDCKIDNLVANYVSESSCDSCGKNIENDLLDITLKSELLCYAITCSSKSKVWELYNYINNMLTEYNCFTC